MPPPTAESNPPLPPPDATNLRSQAIAALKKIIYTPEPVSRSGCLPRRLSVRLLQHRRAEPTDPAPATDMDPAHDPVLRRRTEAVELLGRFDDPAAVQVLDDLLLRGRHQWAAPVGQWLHDSALLTLLQSPRLPRADVDRTLRQAYSFLRHPLPWQWSAVYDDLPLLQRYRKLEVFFWAFWLWPLLIFAVPTLIGVYEILFPGAIGARVGGGFLNEMRAWLIVIGTGVEIYLVHQVVIGLLAGLQGPPWRVPPWFTTQWKGWIGAGLTLVAVGLLVAISAFRLSGCEMNLRAGETVAPCEIWLRPAILLLPLLLLPMFILAHDLETATRYTPKTEQQRLRHWAVILRRVTDLLYIFALPGLSAATLSQMAYHPESILATRIAFLAYLFVAPLLTVLGARVVTRIQILANTAKRDGNGSL